MSNYKHRFYLHFSFRVLVTLAALAAVVSVYLINYTISGDIRTSSTFEADPADEYSDDSTPQNAVRINSISDSEGTSPVAESYVLLSPYTELSFGSTGTAVTSLARKLCDLGFLEYDYQYSEYNTAISDAVVLFQRVSSLAQTGIASSEIQRLIFSDYAPKYVLRPGDSGQDVSWIQTRLKEIDLYAGRENGYFGKETYSGLTSFFSNNPLEYTADLTNEHLYALSASILRNPSSTQADSSYSVSGDSLAKAAMDACGCSYKHFSFGPVSFDNAGFIWWCLSVCGIQPEHLSVPGFASLKIGKTIMRLEELQKGDLLFFSGDHPEQPDCAGIYVGSGIFVYASAGTGTVIKSNLNDSPARSHFLFARRMF